MFFRVFLILTEFKLKIIKRTKITTSSWFSNVPTNFQCSFLTSGFLQKYLYVSELSSLHYCQFRLMQGKQFLIVLVTCLKASRNQDCVIPKNFHTPLPNGTSLEITPGWWEPEISLGRAGADPEKLVTVFRWRSGESAAFKWRGSGDIQPGKKDLDFNSLKCHSLGFRVFRTGYWPGFKPD